VARARDLKSMKSMPSLPIANAALAGLLCLSASACSSTPETGPGEITSSQSVASLTVAEFTEQCDARGGTVEVIPHCGGINTCKGFSYDKTTGLLSEHSCRGAATCSGWNCLVPD
jgi:hypothetical protein